MTEKRFITLESGIDYGVKDTMTGDCVFDVDITELLNELHEENQKLIKVIEEDEKLIQSTYDELTKLRCIKKNLERIKAQWDWIMEAVQYD